MPTLTKPWIFMAERCEVFHTGQSKMSHSSTRNKARGLFKAWRIHEEFIKRHMRYNKLIEDLGVCADLHNWWEPRSHWPSYGFYGDSTLKHPQRKLPREQVWVTALPLALVTRKLLYRVVTGLWWVSICRTSRRCLAHSRCYVFLNKYPCWSGRYKLQRSYTFWLSLCTGDQ